MSKQISTILKRKLDGLVAYGDLDTKTRRNTLKEELQFYVLNFIYHHSEYSSWIMYGGSALRIIHGLDRMSVDLDFEVSHAVTKKFLEELKKEIEKHFLNTYGAEPGFLATKIATGRGLLLKFYVGDDLSSSGHHSKQVHVKIDLNHFVAPKTVTERRPINRDQLSFVILTYNMSSLMASKLAAIFLRGTRGVGEIVYEEKGRDIYDLLWYMNKKVVPNFDYLIAKGIDAKDPRALFDKLTIQMNKVDDKNLEQDLGPLFLDKNYIGNWIKNWRESYFDLLEDYKINVMVQLKKISIIEDGLTDNLSFICVYNTTESRTVKISYEISYEFVEYEQIPSIEVNKEIEDKIVFMNKEGNVPEVLKRYASLFYQKNENYFKKTNNVILGDTIATKFIRITSDNLNPKEEIRLNKSALLSCELDDLLK